MALEGRGLPKRHPETAGMVLGRGEQNAGQGTLAVELGSTSPGCREKRLSICQRMPADGTGSLSPKNRETPGSSIEVKQSPGMPRNGATATPGKHRYCGRDCRLGTAGTLGQHGKEGGSGSYRALCGSDKQHRLVGP